MQQNVGRFDRIARLALGALLVVVGVAGYFDLLGLAVLGLSALTVEVAAVLVGAVLLVTGATRQCPIYAGLGISTLRADEPVVEGDETTPESSDDATVGERPRAN